MRVDAFDFDLPDGRIALRPASPRESAKLLFVGPDRLSDETVGALPELLRPGDLLVFNDTKVIPAQLTGRRGQARIEVTLHQPSAAEGWYAFARPARRLKAGDRIDFADGFSASVRRRGEGGQVELTFDCRDMTLRQALERYGEVPLPPYIRKQRPVDEQDRIDYQTIFADREGAVAAPTAGLHFTAQLMDRLAAAGVDKTTITLHVGAGTFLPVSAEDTDDHPMHAEYGEVTADVAARINEARARGGRLVAVGTTVVRLLESAADEAGCVHPFAAETDIFITPGYRFRAIDLMFTNFHLPKSTLFMLVCAFAGVDSMKTAYRHAIAKDYRFYSYGDACLLQRQVG